MVRRSQRIANIQAKNNQPDPAKIENEELKAKMKTAQQDLKAMKTRLTAAVRERKKAEDDEKKLKENMDDNEEQLEELKDQVSNRNGAAPTVQACGVCALTFKTTGDRAPRVLLCGHTVCTSCARERVVNGGHHIECPFEPLDLWMDRRGVDGLPINYALF